MTTVTEYLEEETQYITDSDMPAKLRTAEVLHVYEGEFSYETNGEWDEDQGDATSLPVLEFVVEVDGQEETFIVICLDEEEWFYYEDLDAYLADVHEGADELSYNYEVSDDDIL